MNDVAEAATQSIQKQVPTIYDMIENARQGFARSLPAGFSAKRFVELALRAVDATPALKGCSWKTVVRALKDCAHMGLEPNSPLHEGAIIPYKKVATFQPEYRGILKLVWNSGLITSLDYGKVCSNDVFEVEHGSNQKLKHIPNLSGERGEVYAYYACANILNGGFTFVVKTKADIQAHAQRFSKAWKKEDSPWHTDFDAMAYKTVLLELGDKKLPKKTTNEALLFHRVAVSETSGDILEGRINHLDLDIGAFEEDKVPAPPEEAKSDDGSGNGQPEDPPVEQEETKPEVAETAEPTEPTEKKEKGTDPRKTEPEDGSETQETTKTEESVDENEDSSETPILADTVDGLIDFAADFWKVPKGKTHVALNEVARNDYQVTSVTKLNKAMIQDLAKKIHDGTVTFKSD